MRYRAKNPVGTEKMSDPGKDYAKAFYEVAALMGIGARANTPEHVWRTVMFPRLQAAFCRCDMPADCQEAAECLDPGPSASEAPASAPSCEWLREAFDGDSVPAKNIALRKAYDLLSAGGQPCQCSDLREALGKRIAEIAPLEDYVIRTRVAYAELSIECEHAYADQTDLHAKITGLREALNDAVAYMDARITYPDLRDKIIRTGFNILAATDPHSGESHD